MDDSAPLRSLLPRGGVDRDLPRKGTQARNGCDSVRFLSTCHSQRFLDRCSLMLYNARAAWCGKSSGGVKTMINTILIHMMAVAPVVTEYLIWILFVAFRLC